MLTHTCQTGRGLRAPLHRLAAALGAALAVLAAPAAADTLTGVAVIASRMALTARTTFEAVIEDVSRADAPAEVIAGTVIANPAGPTIPFAIEYDPAGVKPDAIYSLRATIRDGGALIYTTDTINRVLTGAATGPVEVRLRPVGESGGSLPRPRGAHGLHLPASFTGVLPCADCEGVRYHLDLWPDQVYQMRREWLGRAEGTQQRDEIGRWHADPARDAIVLHGAAEMPLFWQVKAPDRLRQMDMQGNRIESDLPYELASHGRLAPADLDSLLLAGEVLIGGEGPALRECVTGRVFAVATDGAYPDLAAAVEARREGPDTPLLVSLEGSIAHPAPSPGSALAPQMPRLTVQRFVNAFPGEACDRPEPVAAFANTYWRIDSLNGAALPPVDGVREPHIVLVDTPEARFRATVGCNQLLGGFTRAGDALNFQAGISTLMACPPPLDTAERALAEVLAATRTARQTGQQMVFEDKDGRVTAELTAVYLR